MDMVLLLHRSAPNIVCVQWIWCFFCIDLRASIPKLSESCGCFFNRGYGPVQDVRIPFQQKRMFGFVTFMYPETVKAILSKGNPHYICGARVLVKPYKEKTKHNDR
jgi:hypothetical protein